MHPTLFALSLSLLLVLAAPALHADDHAAVEAKLKTAMTSETRTEAEKARDKNRKPLETLMFFGLRDNMRVLELVPGGGWYTKLLAPVLADNGELQVAIGTDGVERMVKGGQLAGVEVVPVDLSNFGPEPGGPRYVLDGLKINTKDVDMVLTFRNLHNFTETSRAAMNAEAFRVLKKGGVYGVVDHTRRHMQADNYENWRRMDPVLMIKEIEAAGFEFVDFSDLHYRYDDELVYEVGRRSVSGNTDRFTLLFRKP